MNRIMRMAVIGWLAGAAPVTLAQDPQMGPIFKNFGPTFKVEKPALVLPPTQRYKAVFDIAAAPADADKRNARLESVARFINMHARHGADIEQLQLAVVFHGAATDNALTQVAYRKRHGTDNPNLLLMQELADVGVRFYLCGQSAGFRGVNRSELAPPVGMALSAMTALVLLQDQGYALLPAY